MKRRSPDLRFPQSEIDALKMTARDKQLAAAVLVDGKTGAAAAREFGVCGQRVNSCVHRALYHLNYKREVTKLWLACLIR